MKRNLYRIGLAATLALGLVPAAVGAETKVFHYQGNLAHAFFQTLGPDGCIETWADVNLLEFEYKTFPSPQETSHGLMVAIARNDLCQSVSLNLVYGFAFLSEDDYSFGGGLHSAHVGVTFEGSDFVTGATVPLTVDVTWEGVGDAERTRDRQRINSPEFKWMFRSRGISREAAATGSVLMSTALVTPAPAVEAGLSTNQQGTVTITH